MVHNFISQLWLGFTSSGLALSSHFKNEVNTKLDLQSSLPLLLLPPLFLFLIGNTYAASGPVTGITTHIQSSTNTNNYVGSDNKNYTWGTGTELVLDTFNAPGGTYSPSFSADNITVRRLDNAEVSGTRCALFTEATSQAGTSMIPGLECDLATVMSGRVINRGWLDVFSNLDGGGLRTPNNIERIDFIYSSGVFSPGTAAELANSGFLITEKSGNNPTVMAAITGIDGAGDPSSFGPLVKIHPTSPTTNPIRYGLVGAKKTFSFVRDGATSATQNGLPESIGGSKEYLGMAFVSATDLGITINQQFYGFSYFSQDVYDASQSPTYVKAGITATDHTTFPDDTSYIGTVGDADMYGGMSGYFTESLYITANNDDFTSTTINGSIGGATASVFSDNGSAPDNSNGLVATDANINNNISIQADDGLTGVSINSDGTITVPSSSSAGTYDVQYKICLESDITVCDTAIAKITVTVPTIITSNNGVCEVVFEDFGSGSYPGSALPVGQTTYTYKAPASYAVWPDALADGEYVISPEGNLPNGNWQAGVTDHTGGGYMYVNNAGLATGDFYNRDITLLPSTQYDMSTWAVNLNSAADETYCSTNEPPYVLPNLKYEIRDKDAGNAVIASFTTGFIIRDNLWKDFEFSFNTGSSTNFEIVVINNGPGGCGNDVAIDDILLKQVSGTDSNGVACYISADYGDAPVNGTAPDGTSTNSYGEVSHAIVSGVYLGVAEPDAESANQPSASADGDDTDGTDDEDGISIPALTQAQTSTITATVAGAGAYLQSWIDFNGNGAFDTNEQVATDIQDGAAGDTDGVSNGTITFDVVVPVTATTNQTYARFRWSTTSGLDSTTAANDGEVEDYQLTITSSKVYQCPNVIADLWFANDESGSVSTNEFNDALDFLYQVSDEFIFDDVTGIKAGITGWGDNQVSTEIVMPITESFGDTGDSGLISTTIVTNTNGQGLRELYDTKKNASSGTRLDHATTYLTNLINNGNGRRSGVRQLAVILTDAYDYQITGTGGGNAWVTAANNLRNAGPDGTKLLIILTDAAATAYNTDANVKAVVDSAAGTTGKVFVGTTYAELANPVKGYIDDVVTEICGALQQSDYSDAPVSYGAASHVIPTVPTVYLGNIVPDDENAIQLGGDAGIGADGDDADGTDDEDGISAFPVITDLDTSYTIPAANITAVGVGATLHAWIDFDGNTLFDDDEYTSAAVGADLVWASIPAGITIGDTYARFRLTTDASVNATTPAGEASDGEVEDYALTIDVGGFKVSGRVFDDSNVDGINNTGESGISSLPIVLFDMANTTCISTRTDADGYYEFFPVIPGNYQLYEASRETVPTPQNCGVANTKDPAGYRSTTDNVLAAFNVVAADVTDKDFGDVKLPAFMPDHSGTVLPGNVVFYTHTFTPKSNGSVNLAVTSSNSTTTGWSMALYQDSNCNGLLDGVEGNTVASSNLATTANTKICLINKVYAPTNASGGETYTNVITAVFDFNGNSLAGNTTLKVTDHTKAAANDDQGVSRLELRKTVENITQSIPETATQNQAKPGDVLKYRIYYSNSGTSFISDFGNQRCSARIYNVEQHTGLPTCPYQLA